MSGTSRSLRSTRHASAPSALVPITMPRGWCYSCSTEEETEGLRGENSAQSPSQHTHSWGFNLDLHTTPHTDGPVGRGGRESHSYHLRGNSRLTVSSSAGAISQTSLPQDHLPCAATHRRVWSPQKHVDGGRSSIRLAGSEQGLEAGQRPPCQPALLSLHPPCLIRAEEMCAHP